MLSNVGSTFLHVWTWSQSYYLYLNITRYLSNFWNGTCAIVVIDESMRLRCVFCLQNRYIDLADMSFSSDSCHLEGQNYAST